MINQEEIQMVDLQTQYLAIKNEIDSAIFDTIDSGRFIKGEQFNLFEKQLAEFLNAKYVIACANGTDALQIALMALDLKPEDEVIVPAFTYAATAEVVGLLGLKLVMVDVDPHSFNVTKEIIEKAITPNTKVIVPVHLFGQSANMEEIMEMANKHNIYVVEDNAQALGSEYKFSTNESKKTGTIGHIGCTSFFPSKNLGCFGDGGALFTNNDDLAKKIRMIANHGQSVQYTHDVIGVNSRLDAIQAAILLKKLPHLNKYNSNRAKAANYYDTALDSISEIEVPHRSENSTHVFHQYTIKVKNGKRDQLREYLKEQGVPSMIYYPISLHKQKAYSAIGKVVGSLETSTSLCQQVLSLPMHTELKEEQLAYICQKIKSFFQ